MKKTGFFLIIVLLFSFFIPFSACKKESKKTSYGISCVFDGNEIKGSETLYYYNGLETSLSFLKFNLYPNAFREGSKYSPVLPQYQNRSYYNGENYGSITIDKVSLNGEDLTFNVEGEDENVLTVHLKEELFPDESVLLTIDFTTVLANVIARTGINEKSVNIANFYPVLCARNEEGFYECVYSGIGDPFFSEVADYQVDFKCDKNYIVASSGEEIKTEDSGDTVTYYYKTENARSFALVLSKEFKIESEDCLGINVKYYHYSEEDTAPLIETAKKALWLFSEKFGKYQYKTLSIVETKLIQGGMEYTALAFISDDLEEKAKKEVIVHEISHQWWQVAVGNNEVENAFLDEGLAEYSVVLFYENYIEYGFSRNQLIKTSEASYHIFCDVYKKLFQNVDTAMQRNLKDFSSEYEYVNIAYIKGCIMFDDVRNIIGDENFFSGLQNYYKKYCFKVADSDALIESLSAKINVKSVIDAYIKGKDII